MRIVVPWLLLIVAACASKPRTGTRVVNYPNGTVRWSIETINDVPHGLSQTFHVNGKVASRGRFEHGAKVGVFEYFDSDGRLEKRVAYLDGDAVWTSHDESEPPPRDLEALRPPPPIEPPAPPLESPSFGTLDRATRSSRVGARVGLHSIPALDGFARRLDLNGQYNLGRYSVYGQLTTSAASMGNESVAGKMSLELGGLAHHSMRLADLTLRAGAIVPLANDDLGGFVSGAATAYQRLTDVASSYPETLPLRVSASALRSMGVLFVGVDVGVDGLVRTGDDISTTGAVSFLGRLNLGVGVGNGTSMLSLELANVGFLGDSGDGMESFAHAISLVARAQTWRVQPIVGVSYPFLSGTSNRQVAMFAGIGVPIGAQE